MLDSAPATPLSGSVYTAPVELQCTAMGSNGSWQQALVEAMPRLGTVGCLYSGCLRCPGPMRGVRILSPELHALPRARSVVVARGVLPSIEVVLVLDRQRLPVLGLVQLPETDFFEWDQMLAAIGAVEVPVRPAAGVTTDWMLGIRCFSLGVRGTTRCLCAQAVPYLSIAARTSVSGLLERGGLHPDHSVNLPQLAQ